MSDGFPDESLLYRAGSSSVHSRVSLWRRGWYQTTPSSRLKTCLSSINLEPGGGAVGDKALAKVQNILEMYLRLSMKVLKATVMKAETPVASAPPVPAGRHTSASCYAMYDRKAYVSVSAISCKTCVVNWKLMNFTDSQFTILPGQSCIVSSLLLCWCDDGICFALIKAVPIPTDTCGHPPFWSLPLHFIIFEVRLHFSLEKEGLIEFVKFNNSAQV